MKRMFVVVLFLIAVFVVAVRVTLAEQPKVEPTPPPKKIVYKKTESHEFSGAKLKGQLKKPDLSYIYERKGLRAEQIVNIPDNFNAEITRGAAQF